MKTENEVKHTPTLCRVPGHNCKTDCLSDVMFGDWEKRLGQAMWDQGFSMGEIDDVVRALKSHAALLEAAKIGLRIAEAYADESESKLTQAFWDDKDQIIHAIAQAEPKP